MGIYDRDYYQADELRPLRPWDNKSMVTLLIIANVAVFVANYIFSRRSNAFSDTLSLYSQSLWDPLHFWQLLTYGFVHSPNVTHILFNMVGLYFLGRSVEDRYGKWEFLRFYLFAIVVCGVAWAGMRSGMIAGPLCGASGATTAVSMLFIFCFPQATLMLYMAVPVKAWLVGVIIIVGNVMGTQRVPTQDGFTVAYDVHLVGAAVAAGYFFGGWNFGFLGGALNRFQLKARQKRSGLKVHHDEPESQVKTTKDELESDRILEKIFREGEDSLTRKERKFMEGYSRKVRDRRGD